MNDNNYCVILAGGIGLRLWPSSRQDRPKQFIDFIGMGESLLQYTYHRFSAFMKKENILVVTNQTYYDLVREQLPELPEENALFEPIRRNTVASVLWAAMKVRDINPNANMAITPVDQMISNAEIFQNSILRGLDYVSKHKSLLTLGVMPTRPDTNYGYIQMNEKVEDDIYSVRTFTEKPELEFAKIFVENKEFLWNTGLFIWNADTFIQTVKKFVPEYSLFINHWNDDYFKNKSEQELSEAFSLIPSEAVETGVLEKADNVDVMLCHFGWADIGTWDSLYNTLPKDRNHNVVINSKAMMYGCNNCVVKLPSGKIAMLQDLDGYIIAEEGDVLVVCKREDQGGIRRFVNDLQLNLGEEYM